MQGASLYIPERFGADRTLYGEVTRTWCFMAKDLNGWHHRDQQLLQSVPPSDCALTCYFHLMLGRKQAVNVMSIGWCLSDFLCPVGGALDMTQYWCTDIFGATPSIFLRDLAKSFKVGMNLSNLPPRINMADFLLAWPYRSPDFFVRLHMMNLRNKFHASMCTWMAGKNNRGRYRACRSRPRPMTWNYQIIHRMWRIFQIWWVLGYVQASKTAVKPQKNNSLNRRRIIL